jgi:multiple sugar transport system permease protein
MATTLDRGLERDQPTELTVVGTKRRTGAGRVLLYLILLALAAFFVLPLVVAVGAAFKDNREILVNPGLFPRNPSTENFQELFGGRAAFLQWFRNSAIVSTLGTAATVILTSLSAYAFARIDFPLKNVLFGLLITTLVLPSVMFLVPQYKLVAEIGLYDSLPALALPGIAGVFGVFFMRQFFLGLPVELEEAAYVDGATRLRTFISVALPMAGPALATLSVITFLAFWNDYLWPVIICQNNCTLPAGLRLLQGQFTGDPGLLMAGAVVSAIPVLILYVALQRYIVQSVASSGIKG